MSFFCQDLQVVLDNDSVKLAGAAALNFPHRFLVAVCRPEDASVRYSWIGIHNRQHPRPCRDFFRR
jgi:hypothetical protein